MRRRILACAAVAVTVAACGGSSSSRVDDASLGRIHSGVLHLHLELGASDPSARVGFAVDGPFDLSPGRALPVADLTSTDLGHAVATPMRFLATGDHAYVVRDDVGYELTAAQLAPLRAGGGGSSSSTAFAGLDLSDWVVDPVGQPPTTLDGEQVERVTGGVDPVTGLNAIVTAAGQLGQTDTGLRISDAEAQHVRDAVSSSRFELLTGHDDHLLRSLTAVVEFDAARGATGDSAVIDRVRALGHLTMTISLRIERPNTPVQVRAPATVRPISDLPKG